MVKSNAEFKAIILAIVTPKAPSVKESGVLLLAFDCSSPAGSVAVLDGRKVLARESLDPAQRSAQSLAPAIGRALQTAGKQPRDVGLVATTVGPGSFTGLRVGVTMAKTLAYALKCDLAGLNTLEVLAAQAWEAGLVGETGVIHAVLDAQRKELFVRRYEATASALEPLRRLDEGESILSADLWLKSLHPGDVVTGSGLIRWKDQLPPAVIVAPAELFEAEAVMIGRLALRDYEAGRRDDLWTFSPLYIRPSYAEEKKK